MSILLCDTSREEGLKRKTWKPFFYLYKEQVPDCLFHMTSLHHTTMQRLIRLLEEIDESNDYVSVNRIPSYKAYQWMVDFVDELVTPVDENAAEKLSIALEGKGAFRRFKDTLHRVDEQWLQAWYQWRDKQLKAAVDQWLKEVL